MNLHRNIEYIMYNDWKLILIFTFIVNTMTSNSLIIYCIKGNQSLIKMYIYNL